MEANKKVTPPDDFHPEQFARGRKHALELEFASSDIKIKIPVLLARGHNPGKVLALTAGVHGDEYEGIQAIFDVYQSLDPLEMTGDLLAVPVANPLAFWGGTRASPEDGGNLARCFPGSLSSSPTAAIAYHLARSIIARADFFLDFHSAGKELLMPTMAGYDPNEPRSHEAALIFGAPVLWAHPEIPPGRTISFAKSRGIPWLYTEARGAGRIDPGDLTIFTQGLRNLLRHLAIIPGTPSPARVNVHLFGDGNTDSSIAAGHRGFFIPVVKLLQTVRHGDELGRIVNLLGDTLETFQATRDGVIALLRQTPLVEPGAPLFLLADILPKKTLRDI